MQDLEKTLDEYQLQYYNEDLLQDKAVILYAVAGAGKTHTTLSKAIKLISKQGVDPKEIYLSSFTNLAARELQNRFKSYTNHEIQAPAISTLHGMGRMILQRAGISLFPITEWGGIIRVREAIENKLPAYANSYKKELTSLATNVYDIYSRLRNTSLVHKHSLQRDLAKVKLKHDILTDQQIKSIILKYEDIKTEQDCMDYDDMIWIPNSIYKEKRLTDPSFNLLPEINYYFIDEAQDLSQSQYDLILNHAQGKSLTLIGDLCQAIYEFRQATPENFSESYLSKFFKEVKTLTLENNYRSTPAIVKVSNFVRDIAGDNIQAKPNKPDLTGSVKVAQATNNVTEGRYITDQVKQLLLSYEPEDIIIICRTSRYIKSVLEPAFINANIAYKVISSNGGKRLLDKPLSQFYLDVITYICNKKDNFALINILSKVKGIGQSNLSQILKELTDSVESESSDSYSKLVTKRGEVLSIINQIQAIRMQLQKPHKVISLISNFARENCLQSIDLSERNIEIVSLSLSNYISLQIDAGVVDTIEILTSMLNEIQIFEDEQDTKRVRLATVHSQKGCETKVVFCAGFNSQVESGYLAEKSEAQILYVQVSRAIDKLFIIDSREYLTKAGRIVSNYKNPYFTKLFKKIQEDKGA